MFLPGVPAFYWIPGVRFVRSGRTVLLQSQYAGTRKTESAGRVDAKARRYEKDMNNGRWRSVPMKVPGMRSADRRHSSLL